MPPLKIEWSRKDDAFGGPMESCSVLGLTLCAHATGDWCVMYLPDVEIRGKAQNRDEAKVQTQRQAAILFLTVSELLRDMSRT